MPYYLTQAAYTPGAWETLMLRPQNRIEEVVRPAIEQMGGAVEGSWLAFGEHDVVLVTQMPDNVSSAAFAMAVAAGGAVKSIKTTPLMSWEEGIEAMRQATGIAYQPPSG